MSTIGLAADGASTVVVTGASGAIGAATATWFLDAGNTVLGLDRVEASLDRLGYRHRVVDLTDESSLEATVGEGLEGLPPLAHVAAIAGGALPGEPDTQDEPWTVPAELFRASVDANLTTQFLTVRATIPHLLAGGHADCSVALTSSFNGFTAQGMPAYSAAKAGLVGLCNALVGPLGARGVRVNVIAPGTVVTPRTMRLWAGVPGHFQRLAETTVLGRLAVPEDVAATIGSLALHLRHVTGETVFVDGGQSTAPRRSPRPADQPPG